MTWTQYILYILCPKSHGLHYMRPAYQGEVVKEIDPKSVGRAFLLVIVKC